VESPFRSGKDANCVRSRIAPVARLQAFLVNHQVRKIYLARRLRHTSVPLVIYGIVGKKEDVMAGHLDWIGCSFKGFARRSDCFRVFDAWMAAGLIVVTTYGRPG
jgi:hypothetical protein